MGGNAMVWPAIIAAGVTAVLTIGVADAACRLTFINGQHGQVCDNALDLPAVGVIGVAPIVPPSIAPIQPPTIPPIGTNSCRQAQVWNGQAYVWRTVCQ